LLAVRCPLLLLLKKTYNTYKRTTLKTHCVLACCVLPLSAAVVRCCCCKPENLLCTAVVCCRSLLLLSAAVVCCRCLLLLPAAVFIFPTLYFFFIFSIFLFFFRSMLPSNREGLPHFPGFFHSR
jgi:hypothetical protein